MTREDIIRLVWLLLALGPIAMTSITFRLAVMDYRAASHLQNPDGHKLVARVLVRDEMMTIAAQIILTAIAVHAWLQPDDVAVRGLAYTMVVWSLGYNSLCRWRDRVAFGRKVHVPPAKEQAELEPE